MTDELVDVVYCQIGKRSMEAAQYLARHGTDVKNYSGMDNWTAKTSRKDKCLGRARENFRGCLPQSSLKNLGQILTVVAISGHLERFSPGQNGSEVGRQTTLNSLAGHPTSEPFGPGENLSK